MRRTLALLVVAGCAAPLACRPAPAATAGTAQDPQHRTVLAFWQALNAATEARLRQDCPEASRLYGEALRLDPRHEDALYYLGQCRRQLGQPAEARDAFERLVAVNPGSARGHLALGALLASPDPGEPMDAAAAEMHLRRAHAINGEETGPMVRLGELLLVTGRRQEAGRWFEAALRTNPKSVDAAFLAGFLAWDAGQAAEARRLAERVRQAAKVEAPVKGVLNEGDRRDGRRAAPPLESPLGRTLFGEPVSALRATAAAGLPLDDAVLAAAWRQLRPRVRSLAARAGPAPSLATR